MKEREKKLLFVLIGVALLIVNIFLFTSYQASMKQKRSALSTGAGQLKQMKEELASWESQQEDLQWLQENPPTEGHHGKIGAELATYTEKSANRFQVNLKVRPSPQREDADESGAYRSSRVKVAASAMDRELYNWLADLQDPQKSRSVTFLRITPERDDQSRVDCVLEVTQWFSPVSDEAIEAEESEDKER